MAVRDALLALLHDGPRHGYQLRSEFELATGSAWSLNIGQVYTTLQRLERDGFVEPTGEENDEGRRPFALTEAGRGELDRWLSEPIPQPLATRDEVSMKVLVAVATGVADVFELIRAQRTAAMATLQSLTAMKHEASSPEGDEARPLAGAERSTQRAWRLHLDRMTLLTEAEIRWLDLTEQRLEADPPTPHRRDGGDPAIDHEITVEEQTEATS